MVENENPELKLTQPIPGVEKKQLIGENDSNVTEKLPSGNIDSEPKPINDMTLTTNNSHSSSNERSSYTLSELGSGYNREENECTEFCLDFCTCFGLFDNCCPTDGEGCLTTTATFIGNIIFSCCKCT